MNLELVVWHDAWSKMGWKQASKITTDPAVVTSCGIVVKEDLQGVVLALDSSDDGHYNTYGLIPLASIVSRTPLQPVSAAPPAEPAASAAVQR
jgi:hypothetical protein